MSVKNQVLKRGSSGSSVKELQNLLNQNGAKLDVDGVFGPKTEAAVKSYQQSNALTVDGMVGGQTMGALTSANKKTTGSTTSASKKATVATTGTVAPTSKAPTLPESKTVASSEAIAATTPEVKAPAASEGFTYDNFSYDDYKESDTVSQAYQALQQHMAAKPGEYQSTWQGQINDLIDRIMNREDFSYDVNSDALYQQYKDQYTTLGKLAMQDTMGQAAAMTGGYGSSYASTAGNQAYQSYLSKLNEVVPELYGMARDQYNQEGQEMYNQYGLLTDQESQDYGKWVDGYNQWASERDSLQGVYNDERNFDYGKYSDERNFAYGTYADDKNYAYNEYRNAIADQQWQATFDEGVRQYNEGMEYQKGRDEVSDSQWNQTHALNVNADNRANEAWELEKQAYADTTKSYSGTTSNGVSYNNGSLTDGQIKELQTALGVDADGKYGPKSKEAAGGLSAAEAYEKYVNGSANTQTGSNKSSKITSAIENKAASFESNDALANWAYGLADAGTITEDDADQLISTYMDQNEKYVDKEDGSKSISFSEMAKSTNGWSVVDNGGTNWFWGVDNNAIVKAPNGEQIRLDNLVDKLVSEGMSKSDAKSYVKKLQKNLNI